MMKTIGVILCFCGQLLYGTFASAQLDVEHITIFQQEGRFAGWPANHGIWIWDNEVLVGFVQAEHKERDGHTYDKSTARDKYARSYDGGRTWQIEDALENGQSVPRFNHQIPKNISKDPTELKKPVNFEDENLALTFLRQTNNIGPSHFYYSYDRGRHWRGGFELPDFGTPGVATRTDYLIDGNRELTAFLTVAKQNGKEGRVMCVRTTDGGITWKKTGWVGEEPDRFEIMPSSVRLSKDEILTAVRKRTNEGKSSIAAYMTADNGVSWSKIDNSVEDTGEGGSPPALLKMKNNNLALGYIVRKSDGKGSRVCVRYSSDDGKSWSDEMILREDGATRDVGYPRMVQRPDGKLVLIYYWNHALREDQDHYRFIAATIFDPLKQQGDD